MRLLVVASAPAPAPPAVRQPIAPPGRTGPAAVLLVLVLALVLMLALPRLALAQTCSPYQGQVTINELRIGKSGSSDAKNQFELFNSGNVAQAVWSTWQLVVYHQQSGGAAVKKGGYYLSTDMISAGQFIFSNRIKKIFLRNRHGYKVDLALVDANGAFIDYVAIEGQIQTVPACLGTPAVVDATVSNDTSGVIKRLPDGGTVPASVTSTANHTIGATNVCTPGGSDLYVSNNADISTPVATRTTINYTITVTNLSCSNTVTGIELTVTGIDSANPTGFSNLSKNTTQGGTTSVNTSPLIWSVGTLAPGSTATLTITGKPRSPGTITNTATITAPASGLVNIGDDTQDDTIWVQAWNYVGFTLATDSVTEGAVTSYSAYLAAAVIPSNTITINYSVSGSTNAGDTNLAASGSVVIDPDDPSDPKGASIEFSVINDGITEVTKTLTLTITSITTGDSWVRLDSAAALFFPVLTITLLDDDGPHHYELSLPSTGLACLASTVTVTACADASSPCTNPASIAAGQTVTLSTGAGTLGSGTLTLNASGQASTTLQHPTASDGATATVTLSGESVAGANPRQCCPYGSACSNANSCTISFSTAGFIIAASADGAAATLPPHTAGTGSSTYYLRAVKTGTSTQACAPALVGNSTVNWAMRCNNPTTCSSGSRLMLTGTSATAISGSPNSGVTSTTPVVMAFDANGNAPFSFNYADVGQITLHASKAAAGTLLTSLSGESNAFVVKPADFALSAIAQTAAPNLVNPGAADASGARFVKAGESFGLTVTARTSSGATAPNFGRENTPEGVLLTAALAQPAGGVAGTLANATIAGGSFSGGVATVSTLSYSEVGIVTLTPSVASGSYLGAGSVSGPTSGNVGRFFPSHFAITPGTPVGACSGAFSYFGQDGFTTPFTLTAQNTANATTRNYAGAFARLTATSWSAYAFSASGLAAGSVLATGASAPTGSWIGGVNAVSAVHQVSRPSALAGETAVTLRATPVDSDGVTMATTAVGAATPLRWGRLRLSNSFGKAGAALQLPVVAEYWNGNAWVLNSADSCTTLPAASVAMSNPRSPGGGSSTATTSASAVALAAGSGTLTLAAPSPAGSGLSLDLAINLGSTTADQSCRASHPATTGAARPWLRAQNGACATTTDRDPAARGSFGIFSPETRRTVHVRELF